MHTSPKNRYRQLAGLGLALALTSTSGAWAGPVGAVAVTYVTPVNSGIIHEAVIVLVTTTSDFAIDTVVADLDGTVQNLAFANGSWSTTIDMTGASWGPKSLSVTATDVFANQDIATIQVNFDLPPVITLITPLDFAVVKSTFPVQATCADDGPAGCSMIEMRNSTSWEACTNTTPIVSNGGPVLNQTANVASFDHGDRLSTCIQGTDSAGQIGHRLVHLWNIDHPLFSEVDSTGGWIVDVSQDHLLFTGEITPGFGELVGVKDRGTGIETTVFDDLNTLLESPFAQLTPLGLIAPVKLLAGGPTEHLWDWRNEGTLFDIGAFRASDLQTRDLWASWVEGVSVPPTLTDYHLTRRDLVNETNQLIATDISNVGTSLAPDGSIIYVAPSRTELMRFDGGTVTSLISDPPHIYASPRTDGGAVAYKKMRQATPNTLEFAIAYLKDGVETLLTPFSVDTPFRFELDGDWLAFGRLDVSGVDQVWLRAPDGTETQASFFATNSRVHSVSSCGALTFSSGTNNADLYLHTPYSNLPVRIGSSQDEAFWFDGHLFLATGSKLFEVNIEIFSNDFESGNTNPWPVVVP